MNDASGQIPSVVYRNRCMLRAALQFYSTARIRKDSSRLRRIRKVSTSSRQPFLVSSSVCGKNCLKRAVTKTDR